MNETALLPTSLWLGFKPGVKLLSSSDGQLVLDSPGGRLDIGDPGPALRDALSGLAREGSVRLARLVGASDSGIHLALTRLFEMGLICPSVLVGGHPLARLVPIATNEEFSFRQVLGDTSYTLSRFAHTRRDRDRWVLESPLAHAHILLKGPIAGALLACASGQTSLARTEQQVPGLPREEVMLFLSLLLTAGMLCEIGDGGTPDEDRRPELVQWEFHDLLFHAASRLGRHDRPIGHNPSFLGVVSPLPAVQPSRSEERVELYTPDLQALRRDDPPFSHVLEERKSIRQQGDKPLSAAQLGEFLFRVGRVRNVQVQTLEGGVLYEESSRPYPNGGACYELELYPIVYNCDGLRPGAYHYEPAEHQLSWLSPITPLTMEPLEHTRVATGQRDMPQVLITITARFQRLTWKYRGIAYATLLKDVGVLYQTMYLAATAMGLAPCALGGGDSDIAAEALGLDYYAETSVGEFFLGSRPRDGS